MKKEIVVGVEARQFVWLATSTVHFLPYLLRGWTISQYRPSLISVKVTQNVCRSWK